MPRTPLQPNHPNNWRSSRAEFGDRIRSPHARETGLALCDAMISWDGGRGPIPSLGLLTAAINSGAMWVSHSAAHDLGFILPLHGDPFELAVGVWRGVRALGRSRLAWEADRVCVAMDRDQAVAFRTLGLQDRSKLVRGDAAYVAAKCGLRELLPVLHDLARSDPIAEIRQTADLSAHLLDRGYRLTPTPADDRYCDITILCELGGRFGTSVDRSVVETLGIDRVIDEVRRHAIDLSPYSWETEAED